jgi:hypothetical protein
MLLANDGDNLDHAEDRTSPAFEFQKGRVAPASARALVAQYFLEQDKLVEE